MLCLAKGTIPFLPVRHLRLGAGNIPIIPHVFSCGCHLPMGQSLLNVLHVNPVACSIIPTCDESALSPVLGAPCERKPRDSGFTPRHWPQPMVKRGSTALLRIILSHTCARAASNTTVQCSSLKFARNVLAEELKSLKSESDPSPVHQTSIHPLYEDDFA